jgi:hypothetical protein
MGEQERELDLALGNAMHEIRQLREMIERQHARSHQSVEIKSAEDAFADWGHSHRPDEYSIERRAFMAGWVAAVRNKWAQEQND